MTVDRYISTFPKTVQARLNQLRQTIATAAPGAEESISWRMPTFKLHGKPVAYFAAYKHHIGFYPTSGPITAFASKLKPFKHSKGAVQFPLDQPLPLDLVRRMVQFRAQAIGS